MTEQLDTQRYCEGYLGHDLIQRPKKRERKHTLLPTIIR